MTKRGFARGAGFALLAETEDELVVGVLAPSSRPAPDIAGEPVPREFFDRFDAPGFRAAMNFRFAGGILSTETRIEPTDALSGRRFRRYWMLIRPFSGLTRLVWLRAIRRRALSHR